MVKCGELSRETSHEQKQLIIHEISERLACLESEVSDGHSSENRGMSTGASETECQMSSCPRPRLHDFLYTGRYSHREGDQTANTNAAPGPGGRVSKSSVLA